MHDMFDIWYLSKTSNIFAFPIGSVHNYRKRYEPRTFFSYQGFQKEKRQFVKSLRLNI